MYYAVMELYLVRTRGSCLKKDKDANLMSYHKGTTYRLLVPSDKSILFRVVFVFGSLSA